MRFLARMPAMTVVGSATDGLEAVAKAAETRPDLVIMEMAMPRMCGVKAAAAIRKQNAGVRIILLSLDQNSAMEEETRRAGADGLVSKIGLQRNLKAELARLFPALDWSGKPRRNDERRPHGNL